MHILCLEPILSVCVLFVAHSTRLVAMIQRKQNLREWDEAKEKRHTWLKAEDGLWKEVN